MLSLFFEMSRKALPPKIKSSSKPVKVLNRLSFIQFNSLSPFSANVACRLPCPIASIASQISTYFLITSPLTKATIFTCSFKENSLRISDKALCLYNYIINFYKNSIFMKIDLIGLNISFRARNKSHITIGTVTIC